MSARSYCPGWDVLDPQDEPLVPTERPEEKDWRDLCFDAGRSVLNAQRCESHGDRRLNLLAAKRQVEMAIERLEGR